MPAPVVAAIGAVGSIASAGIGAYGASKAADAQKKAAKKAAQVEREAITAQSELAKPYVETGKNALVNLEKLAPYQTFGTEQFKTDPGYQFRMSEGIKALERSASARGLLQSGGTLKGVMGYGQDLASSEYENAFRRYLSERTARLGPYEYLTGIGQSAAAGQAANVGTSAANLADIAMQRGNVQAAGTMGAINALTGGIGQAAQGVGSYYANQPYMNYLQSITPSTSIY